MTLQIVSDGAAAKTSLRIGDRILSVNKTVEYLVCLLMELVSSHITLCYLFLINQFVISS